MVTEVIGRAIYETALDQAGLETGIRDAESKVTQSGARIEKSAFSTGTAFKAAGIVAAGGFGLMTKGAMDMERAQGNFQAATGASREEAVAFAKDMNGIVGTAATVGRSFGDIAGAGTAVAQQFELTGDAGTRMTEKFLGFSKVTRQDAVGAVNDFDAALDAFGEPASRATGLMDQLVASNQKYGTDAGPAALSALQGMAPALQAMGAGLDDGVGLLNLFESAGLDAGAAQRGLQKAVQELKPGENLNDLIQRIGAIEDPTLRAQEAMRIFGTRSGTGLANAIKPGMTSLADFEISVEDAAGASERAADDMVTTADKFRMFADKAIGALRGFGQELGPILSGAGGLVTAFGALPDKLTRPFTDGLKRMFARVIPGVLPAAVAVGTATGGAQATAHEAAATGPGVVRSLFARIAAMGIPLAPAGTTIGTAVGGAMVGGMLVGLAGIGAAAAAFLQNQLTEYVSPYIHNWMFGGAEGTVRQAAGAYIKLFGEALAGGATELQAHDYASKIVAAGFGSAAVGPARQIAMSGGAEIGSAAGRATIDSYAAELSGGVPLIERVGETFDVSLENALSGGVPLAGRLGRSTVDEYANEMSGGVPLVKRVVDATFVAPTRESVLEAMRVAAWGGAQTPGEFSQGLRSDFSSVRSAFGDLRDLMKNTLSPAAQEAELIGIATSKRLARALADGRPEVRGEGQQIALDTIAQLRRLDTTSPEIGRLTTLLLARALPNERPALQAAINQITSTVTTPLGKLPGVAETSGEDIGAALAKGLRNKYGSVSTAAEQLAGKVRGLLEIASPAKEGPWSERGGPIAWMESAGEKMGLGLAHSLLGAVPSVSAAIRRLTSATSLDLMSPSFALPRVMPVLHAGAPPGSASPLGSTTIHLHIGTLIADEAGLAELGRRIHQATGYSERGRLPLAGAF